MDLVQHRTDHPSIIDLLRADDAQVTSLFARYVAAESDQSPPAARERLIGRICETLSVHRLAEEEVLYPAVRAADDKLVFAFLLAGLGISMLVGKLKEAGTRASKEDCLRRLMDLVRRNLQERSQVLFPFVREKLSGTQLAWLGDDYLQRKSSLWSIADAPHAPRAVARVKEAVSVRKSAPIPLWRRRSPGDGAPLR